MEEHKLLLLTYQLQPYICNEKLILLVLKLQKYINKFARKGTRD